MPGEFRAQEGLKAVIAGTGVVRDRLASVMASEGAARPMIVCGSNIARSPVLAAVIDALGATPTVFDGSLPHTPIETVDAGTAVARKAGADAFIAVGGSSAIDCAKGIARLVATGVESTADLEPIALGHLGSAAYATTGVTPVPLVTITTTLSFAEFLPFWGARHADRGRKLAYGDGRAFDRTIFLDGELAAHTPGGLWAETGVKGLDDALSAYCRGNDDEPFADPVLARAIGDLDEWLPKSLGEGKIDERQRVLNATWMTKQPLPRIGTSRRAWFSTAARHSLGSVLQIGHGAASCIALPVGVRFHAADMATREGQLAEAIGWPTLASGLDHLLDRLPVPRHLRALGHDASALDEVAEQMVHESPDLGSVADVRRVCEQFV